MTKKRTYFVVGIFVMTGICLGVVALVWIGATQYFQKGTRYVAYFNQSVQGLQMDSTVKYLGVDVGRVEKIRLAPDFQLIEVVMKIDFPGNLSDAVTATLRMAGLTGIVYIELDKRREKDLGLSPRLNFTSDYPVIPSRPSDISQITTSIDEIIQKIKMIDFNGIAEQVKSTTKAIGDLAGNEDLRNTLAKLESAADQIEKVATRINKITDKGDIERFITEATEIIREARSVVAQVGKEVNGLNLSATGAKVNDFVNVTTGSVSHTAMQVRITLENLNRASLALEEFIERVKRDPSQLIFSVPPPPDKVR